MHRNDPSGNGEAVDISVADFTVTPPSAGIAFATAGDIKVTFADSGLTKTIPNGVLAAGFVHPLKISKVFRTGTSALSIWVFRTGR